MPLKDCVDSCDAARRITTEAAIHGMQQGGKVAQWELVQLLLDTADINETAADFLLRSSRQHKLICQVAADITEKCAAACDTVAAEDRMMREAAITCRKAANACRKLL